MIKEFLQRMREKKELQREMEMEYNVAKKIEQKRKSANERELEGYIKEQRERAIENKLKVIRKQKQKEYWQGKIAENNKKMLGNNAHLLKDKSIMKDGNKILKSRRVV